MKEIKFLHLADIHLDRAFQSYAWMNERIYQIIFEMQQQAFQNAIDFAIEKKVDFVLICGDLFDRPNPSLKIQFFVKKQLERLKAIDASVYMIRGNHDALHGKYDAFDYLPHVHVFSSEQVSSEIWMKNGEALARIYGFSYKERAVHERKVLQYKRMGEEPFHIAMLHGSKEGEKAHAPYAPFTIQEMLDCHMDYYALGHIHKHEILYEDPPMIYSGSLMGLHMKETGEKGGIYVTMRAGGRTNIEFIPFAPVQWIHIHMNIHAFQNIEQWLDAVFQEKQIYRLNNMSVFLVLYLTGTSTDWLGDVIENKTEMLTILNDEEKGTEPFTYIVEIQNETQPEKQRENLLQRDMFYAQWEKQSHDVAHIQERLKSLLRLKGVRKHFKEADFDIHEIKREANARFLRQLWGNKE